MSDPQSSGPQSFDRRDSPRVPMRFDVRPAGSSGALQTVEGDLSVGGARFETTHTLEGSTLEVRFRLPASPAGDRPEKEISAKAEVLRVREDGGTRGYHLKFVDLEIDQELAIAKYLDDLVAGLSSAP